MSNVLIVEDQCFVAEALAATLRPLGARVAIAETMRAAIDRLKANGFTVILLDLTLPDSPRHETIARISEIKREHKGRKVVIMSGPPTEAERAECVAGGADAYLEKCAPDFQKVVCQMAGD